MKLGINIDHVATIRNARGITHPSVLRAAQASMQAGASYITAHLREDRRHIKDSDIADIVAANIPLNMEMATTQEMLNIALMHKPFAVCIVPERREELTTEGGLDVVQGYDQIKPYVDQLKSAGIRVSLFIDADFNQIDASAKIGADVIEIHTGAYANGKNGELDKIAKAAKHANNKGLIVHAGHGLNYDNVGPIATIKQIEDLNIGHFLMGEAIFVGLEQAIAKMIQACK